MTEFIRIRSEHDNDQIKQKIMRTEDLLISEIMDHSSGLIDLNVLSDIVDAFVFLPNTEKVNDQQISPQLFTILSSNQKNKATAEKSSETPAEIHLRRSLEFIWIRI